MYAREQTLKIHKHKNTIKHVQILTNTNKHKQTHINEQINTQTKLQSQNA